MKGAFLTIILPGNDSQCHLFEHQHEAVSFLYANFASQWTKKERIGNKMIYVNEDKTFKATLVSS